MSELHQLIAAVKAYLEARTPQELDRTLALLRERLGMPTQPRPQMPTQPTPQMPTQPRPAEAPPPEKVPVTVSKEVPPKHKRHVA